MRHYQTINENNLTKITGGNTPILPVFLLGVMGNNGNVFGYVPLENSATRSMGQQLAQTYPQHFQYYILLP